MAFVIHDKRSFLANEVIGRVQKQYPSLMFQTMVGINIKIEEAQVKKQAITAYAPLDRGAVQYRELGIEVVNRLKVGILPKKETAYG